MNTLICSLLLASSVVTVDTGAAKCPTSPDLWGLFFEDIDLSLDGGVYAELVRNRSFEDFAGELGSDTVGGVVSDGVHSYLIYYAA